MRQISQAPNYSKLKYKGNTMVYMAYEGLVNAIQVLKMYNSKAVLK